MFCGKRYPRWGRPVAERVTTFAPLCGRPDTLYGLCAEKLARAAEPLTVYLV